MPRFRPSSTFAKTTNAFAFILEPRTWYLETIPMNFSDLGKMKEMMSQAREMQAQMDQKLAETIVEAETGGGMVKVRMNGKKEVLRLKIEPTALGATTGDIELLEDLIAAAVNEAGRRADEAMKSSVSGMLGGLDLPGLG
jgi:DNA-binding YbaB/EbfC family protein